VEGHRSALARDLPRGLPTADISLGHMKISLTLEHTLHMGRHVRVCASCFCTEACSHWFLEKNDDLFARQRPMTEVREYDSNGFRTPGLGAR